MECSTRVLVVYNFFTAFIHDVGCIIKSVHVLHLITLCWMLLGPELYLGPWSTLRHVIIALASIC